MMWAGERLGRRRGRGWDRTPVATTANRSESSMDHPDVGIDGELGTKAADLAAHGTGVVRFRRHDPEELRVRRVGDDVAVTALRARLEVEVAGTVVRGTFRYTRVWAREGHDWRVVGGHVSAVPPLGGETPS
jgi:hypothetical protein